MSDIIITLAEAAKARIVAASSLSLPVTVVRAYYAPTTVEALEAALQGDGSALVTVMPGARGVEEADVAQDTDDVRASITVAVQRRLSPPADGATVESDNAEIDALVNLGHEVVLLFRQRDLEGADCVSVGHPIFISPEDLARARIATRMMTFTFSYFESTLE